MSRTPHTILKDTFGYDVFRPLQREIIDHVLAGRDVLAVMPTGGGKSLCYQIPSLMLNGLTVVISPLIALMKDQVEQMREAGVPALFLNSSLDLETYNRNMAAVREGRVKLLYVAPESLLTSRITSLLEDVRVDLLTIDEAHCISEWGHDFRPEYRQLIEVRRRHPKATCLALTATATPRVREDIVKALDLKNHREFIAGFNRENLYLQVASKHNGLAQVRSFLAARKDQSGIIYCFTRKQVEALAGELTRAGFPARPYHAGLSDEDRRRNQEAFIRDDVQIIVATIAFGMGINKSNVRFVIHYDIPKSIENYYQEVGRAGRDGLPAHCLLLFNYGDAMKLKHMLMDKEPAERDIALQQLDRMIRYADNDSMCRRYPILKHFGESCGEDNCGACDVCAGDAPTTADVTVPAQKLMSCVVRTGERFGLAYVIEVLRGSNAERVVRLGHDKITTHGIGKDIPEGAWFSLGRSLIRTGHLLMDPEHRTLRVSPEGRRVLSRRETIMGTMDEPVARPARRKKAAGPVDYDEALFERLRVLRKRLADDAGVPPYVVFSDRTLAGMSARYPVTPGAMQDIHGVGQRKMETYGPVFMEEIRAYCESTGRGPVPDEPA